MFNCGILLVKSCSSLCSIKSSLPSLNITPVINYSRLFYITSNEKLSMGLGMRIVRQDYEWSGQVIFSQSNKCVKKWNSCTVAFSNSNSAVCYGTVQKFVTCAETYHIAIIKCLDVQPRIGVPLVILKFHVTWLLHCMQTMFLLKNEKLLQYL